MIQRPLIFKLRRLVLPVVLLSVGLALVDTALNWLLVAKTGWLPLDEDVVDYWLPGALAWILVIALIQPRLLQCVRRPRLSSRRPADSMKRPRQLWSIPTLLGTRSDFISSLFKAFTLSKQICRRSPVVWGHTQNYSVWGRRS
jgi:hypothetical protein